MNATLFVSVHGLIAALVFAGFLAWQSAWGLAIGRGPQGDVGFLLATGWTALALYLVVYAYVLRKYAHKLRWSPEFRLQVPRERLERVESRLSGIRREVAAQVLTDRREILERAATVLAEEGCARIARAVVDVPTGGMPRLRLQPTEPLGRVARWMHAHVYYALAGGGLVFLHGGGRFDTPAAIALNGLSLLVIVTGVVGIVLWAFGPTWMTRLERDLTIEEAFVLDRHFAGKLEEALEPWRGDAGTLAVFWNVARARVHPVERARAGLNALVGETPAQAEMFRDTLALAGQRQRVAASLESMMRLRFWLNIWRAVHVPASILLIAVVAIHVTSVLLY